MGADREVAYLHLRSDAITSWHSRPLSAPAPLHPSPLPPPIRSSLTPLPSLAPLRTALTHTLRLTPLLIAHAILLHSCEKQTTPSQTPTPNPQTITPHPSPFTPYPSTPPHPSPLTLHPLPLHPPAPPLSDTDEGFAFILYIGYDQGDPLYDAPHPHDPSADSVWTRMRNMTSGSRVVLHPFPSACRPRGAGSGTVCVCVCVCVWWAWPSSD